MSALLSPSLNADVMLSLDDFDEEEEDEVSLMMARCVRSASAGDASLQPRSETDQGGR